MEQAGQEVAVKNSIFCHHHFSLVVWCFFNESRVPAFSMTQGEGGVNNQGCRVACALNEAGIGSCIHGKQMNETYI